MAPDESWRVLVPLDLSDGSRAVLGYAVQLADAVGAMIQVVYVWEPSAELPIETLLSNVDTGGSRTLGDIARDGARSRLSQLMAEVPRLVGRHVATRVEVGRPAELIVTLAEEGHYDMIVMGTHGGAGLHHGMMGSVAERVLRSATCPVVTVHSEQELGLQPRTA